MSDFMALPKRQSSEEVVQSRRAMSLIRPFVTLFEDWNRRAARASVTALSHLSSERERAQQVQRLVELATEVEAAYEKFETEVAGEPSHSRIDDVRAAFLRLLSVLQQWRGP